MRRSRPAILASLVAALASPLAAQSPTPVAGTQYQAPAWTRGATCYEVFVRSFQDSNGDGIGDINGLISRLDYINDGKPETRRDLGARCIWLMPVAESPSYHGYDVTDYYRVERDYGTNDDFKRLVAEAHRRGIEVVVDMVLNHSSSEHPFFTEALRDSTSPYRQWYRIARERSAEKHPWGAELWHKSPARAEELYYAVFWSGMPDIDYSAPAAREEAKKVATFWLTEMGVDGFRLDAIPYLVEENGVVMHAPGTHALLREYQAHVRAIKPDVYTVGEVWDSTGAMLPYYPDQLDAHFAFDVSGGILEAVKTGRAAPLLPPVLRLQDALPAARWSPFLRNHDVPRTRTELGGDLRKARLASFLLLTLPGLPYVYYGEEIGMIGNKPDERIRTPMQWRRAPGGGFTTGTPWQRFQDDSATTTVEAQERDPRSILALHRQLIHLRDANPALGAGRLVPLETSSGAVTAYLRRDGERAVLVVANLGTTPARRVSITMPAGSLPPGRTTLRTLFGTGTAAPVTPATDGSVRAWMPMATLAPLDGWVFELR